MPLNAEKSQNLADTVLDLNRLVSLEGDELYYTP